MTEVCQGNIIHLEGGCDGILEETNDYVTGKLMTV